MDRSDIEKEVRRLQFEVWSQRRLLWPLGEPRVEAMFDPPVVARSLGLEYEIRDSISALDSRGGKMEAAGTLDRKRGVIAVSSRFGYGTQRFTGAHEIGHYVLHPSIGDGVAHRDRPVFELVAAGRPRPELEADYFAACLLVPMKPLVSAFEARFGTRKPLPLTDAVAFHVCGARAHELFAAPAGSLAFAKAVAGARSFDTRRFPSLSEQFGVSLSAMAIRLQEAGLVAE